MAQPQRLDVLVVDRDEEARVEQKALLAEGVFVSGFGYPVVPKGEARLRAQICATHTAEDLDVALAAFEKVAGDLGLSSEKPPLPGICAEKNAIAIHALRFQGFSVYRFDMRLIFPQ